MIDLRPIVVLPWVSLQTYTFVRVAADDDLSTQRRWTKSQINERLGKAATHTRTFLNSREALHDLALRAPENPSIFGVARCLVICTE